MFDYFRKRRERLAEERRLERAHQLELLNTFLHSLESIQEASARESAKNAEGLIAVATSMAKQAEGFAEWMKCFQVSTPPTTSIVRDEDEYIEEQKSLLGKGLPADIAALPEEFQLAYALQHDPNLKDQ